jgi:hypothetical protein
VVTYIKSSSISKRTKESVVSEEIGNIIRIFLSIRGTVVPSLQGSRKEESQDEYGGFDIDLNDPELAAILGDQPAENSGTKAVDGAFAKVGTLTGEDATANMCVIDCRIDNSAIYVHTGAQPSPHRGRRTALWQS